MVCNTYNDLKIYNLSLTSKNKGDIIIFTDCDDKFLQLLTS